MASASVRVAAVERYKLKFLTIGSVGSGENSASIAFATVSHLASAMVRWESRLAGSPTTCKSMVPVPARTARVLATASALSRYSNWATPVKCFAKSSAYS
ncbi:hypothetical protein PoB_001027600 [Plakobranchus ocellatus]|uniref:Uncharacterized protein n=1 Tax=Plakobranchus ocellatus TaxID=259542 RepID=A0AAV3YMY6_9GAST|nr:hypothetical protein PoB_001027600 [Plakobranchus ocellatus]